MGETERLEISASGRRPGHRASPCHDAATGASPAPAAPGAPRRFTWGAIAATVGIVFVLALLFITAVELISGKPLADIFGNAGSGTSLGGVFTPSPAPPDTTTTTSTTGDVVDVDDHEYHDHHRPDQAIATTTTTAPSASTTSTTTSTTGGVQGTTTTTVPSP